MKLWESPSITISLEEDKKMLIQEWKGHATSRQFREGIEKSIELFFMYKCQLLLTDSLYGGIVNKEDTDWGANHAVPMLISIGMKAQAFVVPQNVFVKLSIRNFGNYASGYKIEYFDNLDKARAWLVSQLDDSL